MGMSRLLIVVVFTLASQVPALAQPGTELRFAIHADPKTFDPLLAEEEVSETIRYLSGGVLIRVNRQTQRLEPELALSWKVLDNARRIDFVLRPKVTFSDGTPFGPADVVATFRRIMDPDLHSAIADSFRTAGGEIRARTTGPNQVSVTFSHAVAGLERLFDQLAIAPDRSGSGATAVLGPFVVTEHKSGQYVLLRRNSRYWKVDNAGNMLPYLDSILLQVQSSREAEMLRFRRGELHLVDKVEPEAFQRLSTAMPYAARNAGASLDSELLWFNQKPDAPVPLYKKRWFQSKLFRQAISIAINRDDLIRLVYRGYAHPAASPVSPANQFWFNSKMSALKYDLAAAQKLLKADGFRLEGSGLRDRDGNIVEFSLITNAGNKPREQMGAIIQQDLAKLGIRLNFLPLEFQSLIERITRSQQYEACLLGFNNVEIDPNSQMNIWMSSGTLHAWNPLETKPATAWENEIDRLMEEQHSAIDAASRKRAFDRVQQIVMEEQPMIYLVHPDVLVAASPLIRNLLASPLPPHLYWNIERISLVAPSERRSN
jgi:peptide/nickel transport system substrate-binding protein